MSDKIQPARPKVRGVALDAQTRCLHYHGPRDVIAVRFRCCLEYYACIDCHRALADHGPRVWPREEWRTEAVLCGVCGIELTIQAYLDSGNRCPACGANFNPGCRNHYHLYFDSAPAR